MRTERATHLHLDPVGGIAGDMFVAALCDARPDLEAVVEDAVARSGAPQEVQARLEPGRRGGLAGRLFRVEVNGISSPSGTLGSILARLESSALPEPVRRRAIALYRRLGEAEATVHGVPLDQVHFHEIADWDSFVDIVAAAALIEALGPVGWSCGPLPLGSGSVATAHGELPVPTPATLRLLRGMAVHEDGLPGERVTPTGAAILAELRPAAGPPRRAFHLAASGHGLGSRELQGRPNLLRVIVLAESGAGKPAGGGYERLSVLRFEIDDQTPEDLALGLDRLRERADVVDVCHWPVVGKRGRLAAAVQVLCPADRSAAVAEACMVETATLGVRIASVERQVLGRETVTVPVGRARLRVKLARRPDGAVTAKTELADLAASDLPLAGRSSIRRRAERTALCEEDEP